MGQALIRWWCRLFHHGVMNLNSETYECPKCHRLVEHNLPRGDGFYERRLR